MRSQIRTGYHYHCYPKCYCEITKPRGEGCQLPTKFLGHQFLVFECCIELEERLVVSLVSIQQLFMIFQGLSTGFDHVGHFFNVVPYFLHVKDNFCLVHLKGLHLLGENLHWSSSGTFSVLLPRVALFRFTSCYCSRSCRLFLRTRCSLTTTTSFRCLRLSRDWSIVLLGGRGGRRRISHVVSRLVGMTTFSQWACNLGSCCCSCCSPFIPQLLLLMLLLMLLMLLLLRIELDESLIRVLHVIQHLVR
mmetsp:Transcript_17291/g.32822  ORF Transcript_17291/g.32822 Transcript_17291/m.32822 type:complete len:248 (+) Transcript_17291:534-1277(+)